MNKKRDSANYIRIDYEYSKNKGLLTQPLVSELEHVFKKKKMPFKIELIHNGFIVFFKTFVPEMWQYLKSCFSILTEEQVKKTQKYSTIFNSATGEKLFVKSSNTLSLDIFTSLKEIALKISQDEDISEALKREYKKMK